MKDKLKLSIQIATITLFLIPLLNVLPYWPFKNLLYIGSHIGLCAAFVIMCLSGSQKKLAILGLIGSGIIIHLDLLDFLPAVQSYTFVYISLFGYISSYILLACATHFLPKQLPVTARIGSMAAWVYIAIHSSVWFFLWYNYVLLKDSEGFMWFFPATFWPNLVSRLIIAMTFLLWWCKYKSIADETANCKTRLPKNPTRKLSFVEIFAYSVLVLGVINLIFSIFIASIRTNSYYESIKPDASIAWSGFFSLLFNILFFFFILSQAKAKRCLESIKPRIVSDGPICLLIAQALLYICAAGAIVGFFFIICADKYDLKRAFFDGFMSTLNLDMYSQLSRIAEIINLRAYLEIVTLIGAWYAIGVAELLKLIRHNTALAYSLEGTVSYREDAKRMEEVTTGT